MSDLGHAVRGLLRQPGPAAVITLTLGVAIGAATVVYSAIDVVWRIIPAAQRDGLVYVASTDTRVIQRGASGESIVLRRWVSLPDLADWAARSTTVETFAGFTLTSMNLTGVDVPARLSAVRVTAGLPGLWSFTPALGRSFLPEEGRRGANPVVLLSTRFWQRQFSGAQAVLGRNLLLDGVSHAIVGVLPPGFTTGLFRDVDVFTPLPVDSLGQRRDERTVFVTARLKPGVSRAQATAELDAVARQLQAEHPETNEGIGAQVLPLIEGAGFNTRILLSIFALIAVLVLVVACATVAGVLVAQLTARRHELAVRAALGEGRLDRMRRLASESFLLAAAGGALGLALAYWGTWALRWLGGDTFGLAEIRLSGRVLAAGLLTALAAPAGFALLPLLRTPAPDADELRDGARAAGAHIRSRRLRGVLVALQAAAAMVLIVQIALLVRTTWALSRISPGFDPAQVVTFRIGLTGERYGQDDAVVRLAADMLTRLDSLPGVASSGLVDRLPIADREPMARLTVQGTAPAPPEERPTVARTAIAGDYLATLRIPVTRGRGFTDAEQAGGSRVALVSEDAARRFWPGRSPVGSRIALDAAIGEERWLEVVGVVGNLRNSDIDMGVLPQVYVPAFDRPSRELAFVVKSMSGDPLQLVAAIRLLVTELDRNLPIHDVASMNQVLFDDLAGTYVLAAMLAAIGLVAMCLSAAGVYGVVAYAVAQRAREIGVRMALGASPRAILRMAIGQGVKPVAFGSLIGLFGAVLLAHALAASVPELDARDPLNYAGVVVAIALVAVAASYVPARRAATIDPVRTLRQE